jgi:hypothetical protein
VDYWWTWCMALFVFFWFPNYLVLQIWTTGIIMLLVTAVSVQFCRCLISLHQRSRPDLSNSDSSVKSGPMSVQSLTIMYVAEPFVAKTCSFGIQLPYLWVMLLFSF